MPTSTYTPIQTYTLTTASADFTFTSIPATYTDLVIAFTGGPVSAGQDLRLQFNADTGSNTNYSATILRGVTTSAQSNRSSNNAYIYLDWSGGDAGLLTSIYKINIMNYTASIFKTTLTRFGNVNTTGTNTSSEVSAGMWRSTSTVTSAKLSYTSGNILAGSTATLYGIKAA